MSQGVTLRSASAWHHVEATAERSLKRRDAGGNGGYYLAADATVGGRFQLGAGFHYRNAGPAAVDAQGTYGGWSKSAWRAILATEITPYEGAALTVSAAKEFSANDTVSVDARLSFHGIPDWWGRLEIRVTLLSSIASPLQSSRRAWNGSVGLGYRLGGRK